MLFPAFSQHSTIVVLNRDIQQQIFKLIVGLPASMFDTSHRSISQEIFCRRYESFAYRARGVSTLTFALVNSVDGSLRAKLLDAYDVATEPLQQMHLNLDGF